MHPSYLAFVLWLLFPIFPPDNLYCMQGFRSSEGAGSFWGENQQGGAQWRDTECVALLVLCIMIFIIWQLAIQHAAVIQTALCDKEMVPHMIVAPRRGESSCWTVAQRSRLYQRRRGPRAAPRRAPFTAITEIDDSLLGSGNQGDPCPVIAAIHHKTLDHNLLRD